MKKYSCYYQQHAEICLPSCLCHLGLVLAHKNKCHVQVLNVKFIVSCVIKYHIDAAAFHARYSLQHMIHIRC